MFGTSESQNWEWSAWEKLRGSLVEEGASLDSGLQASSLGLGFMASCLGAPSQSFERRGMQKKAMDQDLLVQSGLVILRSK